MLDFAIIVPCYNEEAAIKDVLKHLSQVLADSFSGLSCRIFVYDNNSSDSTCQVVTDFISGADLELQNVELRHTYKQGKGYVIREAFQEINAKCYCMIDGDDTYDASSLRSMYDMILDKRADMVIGDRLSTSYFTENKRAFHNFGNRLVRNVINGLFGVQYKDILSGLRTFSYGFVKTFPITSGGFTLETEMNIHAASHDMLVVDIPVGYKDRREGSESKLQTIPDGIRVCRKIIDMIRLYRPMLFYGIITLILMVLGIGFGIPVLLDYLATGEVARFPTLIVCGFTILAALLNLFMGLLQSSNNMRYKQQFEQSYINCITHFTEINNL